MLVGREAAGAELKNAEPLEHNEFKVESGTRGIVRALQMANGGAVLKRTIFSSRLPAENFGFKEI